MFIINYKLNYELIHENTVAIIAAMQWIYSGLLSIIIGSLILDLHKKSALKTVNFFDTLSLLSVPSKSCCLNIKILTVVVVMVVQCHISRSSRVPRLHPAESLSYIHICDMPIVRITINSYNLVFRLIYTHLKNRKEQAGTHRQKINLLKSTMYIYSSNYT